MGKPQGKHVHVDGRIMLNYWS